ncbi:hypothetical protein AAFN46_12000 [Pseudomonas sp. CAU 1711]|uniref:hypothetical protein n=1 Tax=Pseudomonas sp. CAU 1711 TaxID=3140356 RepID=UPI003260F0AD
MLHAVLIETQHPDEQTLRRHLVALAGGNGWRLQRLGSVERCWLLWLNDAEGGARLCGALLNCAWLRRLDCAPALLPVLAAPDHACREWPQALPHR